MINEININNYKRELGGDTSSHNKYSRKLREIIARTLVDLEANRVRVYDLQGEAHDHRAGNKSDILIFINGTESGSSEKITVDPISIAGIDKTFGTFLTPKARGRVTAIKEGDVTIAEWVDETHQLNILFDLFPTYDEKYIQIFEHIMKQFNELVWVAKLREFSWKYTGDKTALTKIFTSRLKDIKSRDINRISREISEYEGSIESYKREIKKLSDNLSQRRRQIVVEKENLNNVSSALINDFDLIIQNEKVADFQVKDGILYVFTNPLYIYSDKGKRYYGGKYKIEINMEDTSVRFFGDNPRRSYWTDHDPHPHVRGNDGKACLGNVEATIAELCSQMQAYALTMICIDFLEAANTSDAAGKNVVNWDEVDEEGNKISSRPARRSCHRCGDHYDDNELYPVYTTVHGDDDDGYYVEDDDRVHVCDECRDSYYHYDDDVDQYIED